METREEYTTTSPNQFAKLLWLPTDLHEWFKAEAKRQDRSANAEMVRALRAYRAAREIEIK
jgi:hypothetical protein